MWVCFLGKTVYLGSVSLLDRGGASWPGRGQPAPGDGRGGEGQRGVEGGRGQARQHVDTPGGALIIKCEQIYYQ